MLSNYLQFLFVQTLDAASPVIRKERLVKLLYRNRKHVRSIGSVMGVFALLSADL